MTRSSEATGDAEVLKATSSPAVRSRGAGRRTRSLGPGKSARTATLRRSAAAASRRRATRRTCSSVVPCEKLMRATSTPASSTARRTAGGSVAGPSVATMRVRRGIEEGGGMNVAERRLR